MICYRLRAAYFLFRRRALTLLPPRRADAFAAFAALWQHRDHSISDRAPGRASCEMTVVPWWRAMLNADAHLMKIAIYDISMSVNLHHVMMVARRRQARASDCRLLAACAEIAWRADQFVFHIESELAGNENQPVGPVASTT
jgi:hypothetical protein